MRHRLALVAQTNRRIRPVYEIVTLIQSDTKRCERAWREFFKVNCNALFQTALLLTADVLAAEAALSESIDELDMSSAPGQPSLAAWEKAVVMRSIEQPQVPLSAADPMTRSMLQPGLRPVIQIERFPRISFVLRMLLGYTTALCAQLLEMDEGGIRMLCQMAVIQLHRKVVADTVET